MANGTNIVGEGWYNELLITPNPASDSLFYLFSIGITGSSQFGLFYSIINPYYNNFNGIVTAKNTMLSNHQMCDGVTAVKHGNGRDWWLVVRPSNGVGGIPMNDFYSFLISPSGIQGPIVQSLGSLGSTNGGGISFSHSGNKIFFVNWRGLIELYDFDRCSGVITNPVNIRQENTAAPYPYYVGSEFSASDSVMYVSSTDLPSVLLQYNLTAANIAGSCDTIASISYPTYCGGLLRLAPDGKIYWSSSWYDGTHYNFPYPDSTFNMYNMNLSVINQPESLGTACDFQPFSFYLGGKRTYYGLPNNPNYNMSAWGGSICDTLGLPNQVSNIPVSSGNAQLNIFYHSGWQTAFINAQNLTGKSYSLSVFNLMGQKVFEENGNLSSSYFTKDLSCSSLSNGMYIVTLQIEDSTGRTEKEILSKKFLKE